MMNKKIFAAFLSALALLCTVSAAHAEEALSPLPKISEDWRFEVTPYLWAPGINSTLFFNDRYLSTASLDSNNVISNLKSGGMIEAEAHYGDWGVMLDFISATLQKSGDTSVTLPTRAGAIPASLANKVTLQQNMYTGGVTYTLLNNQSAYLDGLVGARGITATATLALTLSAFGQSLSASDSKSISTVDPIVGLKGRYRLADSTWYIPFYADIGSGGGTTNLTWQAFAGVGKTFEKWIDASLAYRYLYYDMKGDGLLQKTSFKGPQLSVTFKF